MEWKFALLIILGVFVIEYLHVKIDSFFKSKAADKELSYYIYLYTTALEKLRSSEEIWAIEMEYESCCELDSKLGECVDKYSSMKNVYLHELKSYKQFKEVYFQESHVLKKYKFIYQNKLKKIFLTKDMSDLAWILRQEEGDGLFNLLLKLLVQSLPHVKSEMPGVYVCDAIKNRCSAHQENITVGLLLLGGVAISFSTDSQSTGAFFATYKINVNNVPFVAYNSRRGISGRFYGKTRHDDQLSEFIQFMKELVSVNEGWNISVKWRESSISYGLDKGTQAKSFVEVISDMSDRIQQKVRLTV